MTPLSLNSFLKFGYFLDYSNPRYKLDFSRIDKASLFGCPEKDLIATGCQKLVEAFEAKYRSGEPYLVPLSGGADSRAIIGMLLKHRQASEIHTYTFGTPGTFDYDLGCRLANKLGTRHTAFPLWDYAYTTEELIDVARRIDFQSPLLLHPPVWLLDKYFKGMKIISGANAGAVVGSFVPKIPAKTLDEARLRFINKASFCHSEKLHNCPDTDFLELMQFEPLHPESMTYDEQVYFHERSVKHLAPHVLMKGFDYLLPFVNNGFMDFMLSLDNRFRQGKYLYKKMLCKLLPDLFSFPLEGSYGLPLRTASAAVQSKRYYVKLRQKLYRRWPKQFKYTSPMTNYMDFDLAFREKNDIKNIARDCLDGLTKRKIVEWIDLERIWTIHQDKKANQSAAILLLMSLEIHLRAGKVI
jgi:hypothetical protein